MLVYLFRTNLLHINALIYLREFGYTYKWLFLIKSILCIQILIPDNALYT